MIECEWGIERSMSEIVVKRAIDMSCMIGSDESDIGVGRETADELNLQVGIGGMKIHGKERKNQFY